MNKEFKISIASSAFILLLGIAGCAQYTKPTWTDVNPEGTAYVGQGPLSSENVGERSPQDHSNHSDSPSDNLSHSTPPSVADAETYGYSENSSSSTAYTPEDSKQDNVKDDIEANSDEPPVEDWIAPEGASLKALLTEWSDKSGWRLVWKTERNYELKAGAMFRGRFTDVSAAIVRAFARARPAPIATFYKGNRVLVIDTMEDENAY